MIAIGEHFPELDGAALHIVGEKTTGGEPYSRDEATRLVGPLLPIGFRFEPSEN